MKKIVTIIIIMLLSMAASFAALEDTGNDDGINVQAKSPVRGNNVDIGTETATAAQQNQGEDKQVQDKVQSQIQVQAGDFNVEGGKQIQIRSNESNKLQLKSGNHKADTGMKLMQQTNANGEMQIKAQLSNGKNADVKVMPDAASEKALERLQMKNCNATNGCQIELKEVGEGNQTRAAYEIHVIKQSKILGLFKKKMPVQAQIDAENGEVIKSQKPWWAFLASESEE